MDDRSVITHADLDGAITQMLTNGETMKSAKKEELRVTAYHEAGHAILSRLVAKDPVQKVSIIGNTSGSLGLTIRGGDDRMMLPIETLRARAIMSYGGRAAESWSSARTTSQRGPVRISRMPPTIFGPTWTLEQGRPCSMSPPFAGQRVAPDTTEAKELSATLYQEALQFLAQHRELLDRVAKALLEKETLMGEDLEAIIQP